MFFAAASAGSSLLILLLVGILTLLCCVLWGQYYILLLHVLLSQGPQCLSLMYFFFVGSAQYLDESICFAEDTWSCNQSLRPDLSLTLPFPLWPLCSLQYADPVADLLDQWGVFTARLFRESCVFHRGNYVKDLSRLGRELRNVIIVDNSPASYIFHPENAVGSFSPAAGVDIMGSYCMNVVNDVKCPHIDASNEKWHSIHSMQ